jgi:hypothetical protein
MSTGIRPSQPKSGFLRVACNEPCTITPAEGGTARSGVVWNMSVRGLYLVLQEPMPRVGDALDVTFVLVMDPVPIHARTRVAWTNPPWAPGMGRTATVLPPGLGVEFVGLDARDRERIAERVKNTHPQTVAGRLPDASSH